MSTQGLPYSAYKNACDGTWVRNLDAFAARGADRHLTTARHSVVIGKQLDRVVEAADRIFADAFEIEIAFDKIGERAG
jgi:hypothetical protein